MSGPVCLYVRLDQTAIHYVTLHRSVGKFFSLYVGSGGGGGGQGGHRLDQTAIYYVTLQRSVGKIF